jgi:hypothetical protein
VAICAKLIEGMFETYTNNISIDINPNKFDTLVKITTVDNEN